MRRKRNVERKRKPDEKEEIEVTTGRMWMAGLSEAAIIVMEALMVAENSGIKNKEKLLKYLYENPEKFAAKLTKFIQDSNGYSLPMVRLKGKGQGYYRSVSKMNLVRVSRDAEFYLLPWEDKEDEGKCYIYTHHNWMIGCILLVHRDEIELLGFN